MKYLLLLSTFCQVNLLYAISISCKRVLVIGGSGRVGGSAVRALTCGQGGIELNVDIGGRSEIKYHEIIARHNLYKNRVGFRFVDIHDEASLLRALPGYDLVVNTAGPFQGLDKCLVLLKCMELGMQYLDVCDDISLSRINRGREMRALASKTGGSAIISTGIWPGASSLLARRVIEKSGGPSGVEDVRFSFFTAGSGGAGKTILTATFLLLGEDVLTYRDGLPEYRSTATDAINVDFGLLGKKYVARLNLIECESCASFLKRSGRSTGFNIETRFGTAPPIWNSLFTLMARYVPQSILKDREAMDTLALVSLPMVRLVDSFVGSQNGIRVDVKNDAGEVFTGVLHHDDLEKAVGDSICAFAIQSLIGNVPKGGIYFPEEIDNDAYIDGVLNFAARDAVEYYY